VLPEPTPTTWTTPSIEDHALIGDTRTGALVTTRGEIDWLCAPRFENPPVFGSLIAGQEGGRFSISPLEAQRVKRRYRPGSAVLETTWETAAGVARLTDGMVADVSTVLLPQLLLVRRLEAVEGPVEAEAFFDPRRNFGDHPDRIRRRAGGLFVEWGALALVLHSAPDLALTPGVPTRFRLAPGERVTFVLAASDRAPGVLVGPEKAWELLQETDRWWREWSSRIEYDGPAPESVTRSLITLRLLTYAPSGAPVAAPTTSLPEDPGGERNWDYRFSWARDASLGVTAFLGSGCPQEARAFLQWLAIASRLSRPKVQALYDLEGRPGVHEKERRDVAGYLGSLPVRIGNAAGEQHQLDVYGWIVDAAWKLHESGERLSAYVWSAVEGWTDFVCRHWREPDAGIWERRGEPEHYVHSKLMAWQALDRALRSAHSHRVRRSRLDRWKAEREAVGQDIMARGIDPARGTYTARFGSSELDASLLTLPSVGLEEAGSPRVRRTVEAISSDLDAGQGLLYRYRPGSDQLGPKEGAFLACSFWLVEALCHLDRSEEATRLFESLCRRSNDVGLFAEQIDPGSRGHLGNFPQALTHSTLVGAALAIRRATRTSAEGPGSSRRGRERPA
jgi:GH15 family glucan-1,4-alpha-glucosidase